MKYLFDTDHVSIMQRQSGQEFAALAARVVQHQSEVALCIVSFHEQALGCHTYLSRARNAGDTVRGYRLLDKILDTFSRSLVLPFDDAAAHVLDELVATRVRLATMDLRIASIALSQGLVLLSRNQRDFCKVPGLLVEDWTT